jgi:hypothetical protein
MFDTQNNPTYRAISIITLIQTGVIVFGVLMITAILKLKGYGQGEVPDWFFRSDAVFMRNSGFKLLLIPACWALLATVLARFQVNHWLRPIIVIAGIAAILYGMWYFFVLALNPCIL